MKTRTIIACLHTHLATFKRRAGLALLLVGLALSFVAAPGLARRGTQLELSGTKTVCAAGCDYPSLTGAGGAFEAINGSLLTGNLVIQIAGDLAEPATHALNQWAEAGAGNYTLTIQPADGTLKTITGSATLWLIRLNGADRVTIDGRFNGAGRFLTFRRTGNSPAISFGFGASNNTLRNCILEGQNTSLFTPSVVSLGEGSNNTVRDNQIRDLSTAPGVPNFLIFAGGASTGTTIADNELFNFTRTAISVSEFSPGAAAWTITGNTIYQTAARTSALTGILLNSEGTNLIAQNTIRDLSTSNDVTGIRLSTGETVTVARNRIHSLSSGTGGMARLRGIENSRFTTVTVVNNQISLIPAATGSQSIFGLIDNGEEDFKAYYNTVLIGGTAAGGISYAFLQGGSSTGTLRNNICFNNRSGAGNRFAAGFSAMLISDYNLFVGTGATAANFMDLGLGNPVSFADWQSNNNRDAHSQAGNPGGNFSTAMFVNPANGDLHIVAAGNPLVADTGTPINGITTDYDDDTRSATTPDLGSDELAPPNTAPTISAATSVTRQQGTASSNSTIATVSDLETAAGSLSVTVTSPNPANGVLVSNLVNTNGMLTADIVAACSAANASFTLQVSDGALTNTATLNVTVTANTPPSVGSYSNAMVAPGGSTIVTPSAAPADNGSLASVTATATPNNFTGAFTGNTATGALTITNATQGHYSVTVTVTDNCGASVTRSFMLLVSTCNAGLSQTSASFAASGGAGSFNVTIDAGCPWTATSNTPSFITVTAPGGVSTTAGTVSFTVGSNAGASTRNGTISAAGQTFTVLQGVNSVDVPPTNPFYVEIGKLTARGITLGCGGGNFCPDAPATREQMAALIMRTLGMFNPPTPQSQRFADVPPSNPFYGFIEQLAQRQITLGCGGGNYCPTANVTREQMAAFVIRALHAPGYVPPTPGAQRFLDVPPSSPFYAHIEELAVRGITLGCGGGNYCPTTLVTRAQMAAFLVRAFNL